MRDFLKSPVFLIFCFFVLLFVYSKFGPRIPISLTTQQMGEPLVVSEEGSASTTPDIAKVILGIEESGSSLKAVQNSVNQKSKELVSTLKKSGVGEKDIKTSSYNVYPEYDYESRPAKINGYRVSSQYTVTVRDFEKVNEILAKSAEAGVNLIGNISFELSDEKKQEALALAQEEAVGKAKEKAQSLAKAAGISLGRIINITQSEGGYDYPRPITAFSKIDSEATSEQPQIEPGETEIKVTVTASWEIR